MNTTIDDTMTVSVTVQVRVKLEKIEWSYIKTEDYHVHVDGSHDVIGIVGQCVIDPSMWRAHPAARLATTAEQDRTYSRKYATREGAVAALVRLAARKGARL